MQNLIKDVYAYQTTVLNQSFGLVFFLQLSMLADWKIFKGKADCVGCVIWERWKMSPICFYNIHTMIKYSDMQMIKNDIFIYVSE